MKRTCCFSRHWIERFDPKLEPTIPVLISINEPKSHDGIAKLMPGWGDVLVVKFWDIIEPVPEFRYGDEYISDEMLHPMTAEQAKEIADFIRKHKDKTIYVHCRAGISRSAAVVEILRRLGWELLTNDVNLSRANVHVIRELVNQFDELKPLGA